MKRLSSTESLLRAGVGLAAVAAMIYGVASVDAADSEKPKQERDAKKVRSGEELYRMHCARCHTERYATERTDAQWKTILFHMRTRAPLPAQDAKKIEKYLQETN